MLKTLTTILLLIFLGEITQAQEFFSPKPRKPKREKIFLATYQYSPLFPCQLQISGGRRFGGGINIDVLNHTKLSTHYKDSVEISPAMLWGFGGNAFYSFTNNFRFSAGACYVFEPFRQSYSTKNEELKQNEIKLYTGVKVQATLMYSVKWFVFCAGANLLTGKYHDPLINWSFGIGVKLAD